ncbi:hypothetical protein M3Y98_00241000 [Aphelenchoides besseyi]|nr:hypothetical protein M3Y98_00241000 [Aphelenchoides besseyi]KAI6200673.1 hypothetical protein M3Y96_00759000 [Aphelenchoides besseyi]
MSTSTETMVRGNGPRRRSTYSTVTTSEEEDEFREDNSRDKRQQRESRPKQNTSPDLRTPRVAAAAALSLISESSSIRTNGYSTIRAGIIRFTPETMKCKLYCRGQNCRYCGWKAWTKEQMAIDGLYSNWVTDDILAMARLTHLAIEKFDIIKQFKEKKIVAVFNLQCQNEHSYCGAQPLLKCGFSYDPELLMKNGIYYYNYPIFDFEFCTIEVLLDILKVISFHSDEKIAIHCHAGLGRTGAVIASYLVMTQGLSAEEAIIKVRGARPNSIQTAVQVEIVEQIEELTQLHARVLPITANETLSSYFVWQNAFLPNTEARKYPHIPKLIYLISCRLLKDLFEPNGVRFKPVPGKHHVHSCTFGELSVDWKNVFTHKGRAKNRYIVNVLVQIAGFPYEKDQLLIEQFQRVRVSEMTAALDDLDVSQLLYLLHAYMMMFKKPLASKKALISWFEVYSLESTSDSSPKTAYKDWHCLIFFLCNVLSYLSIQNYDVVTDLITYWLLNDVPNDVKACVHAHLRSLYARNLKEQEQQAERNSSRNF